MNGVVTRLSPGTATANYKSPALLTEDRVEEAAFPIDMTTPAARTLFDARDPRGGAWPTPAPTLRVVTRLVTNVPSFDGSTSTRVVVAQVSPDGLYRPVEPPPSLPDLDRANRHIAGERADYEALLRSISATSRVDSGQVVLSLSPKTPTAVRNFDDPAQRPAPNRSESDRPRLLAYEVLTELERPCSFQANIPGTTTMQTVNTVARFTLPSMSFFVQDNTPPTLGVYLTPVGRGPSMVAIRPQPEAVDTFPQTAKVAVLGDDLGVPGTVRTLARGFDASPYQLDGGGSIPGFVVPENVEVRVQVLAKDNYDRNRNHGYLLSPAIPKPLPVTDTYDPSVRSEAAAIEQAPPYFTKVRFDDVGRRVLDNASSGYAFRFEEAGQAEDLPDRKIFRAANVEVTGPDSFRILPGRDIFLTVRGSDASGNQTQLRIPVLVTPVGLDIGKPMTERERR